MQVPSARQLWSRCSNWTREFAKNRPAYHPAAFVICVLVGDGLLGGWLLISSPFQVELNTVAIRSAGGHAYIYATNGPHTPLQGRWFFEFSEDKQSTLQGSSVQVSEASLQLGPQHSLHRKIREEGLGAYHHKAGQLYFSSSDNTDPRANGRRYLVTGSHTVTPNTSTAMIVLNALALIALAWRFGKLIPLMRNFRLVITQIWRPSVALIAVVAVLGASFTAVDETTKRNSSISSSKLSTLRIDSQCIPYHDKAINQPTHHA